DVPAREQLSVHEVAPGLPERPAGNVEQDDRGRLRLSRLYEREELEGLVHRAEPARQHDEAVGLLDEQELPGEEVPEVHELGITGEELARRRPARQPGAPTPRVLRAGAPPPPLPP